MSDTPKTPFVAGTRTEGLITAGLAIGVAIVTGIVVGEDKGDVAGLSAGAILALIRLAWPVRKELWFWTALTTFVAIHGFAVVHFDWSFTHNWSGHAFSSLMIPDLAAMMAVVYALYRLRYGKPAEIVADLPEEERRYGERDIDL